MCLCSTFFLIPCFAPVPTGSEVYGAQFIKENHLDLLKEGMESGAYDTAPRNIKEANARTLELLEATQGDNLRESLRAQSELRRIDLDLCRSGNLTGDPWQFEASARYLDALASLEKPELYENTAKEPMLYRLAETFGTVPPLALVVPVVAIAFAMFRSLESDRLCAQLPLSRAGKILAAATVTVFVSVASLLACLAPTALVSALLNGVGDPAYPVVVVQGGLPCT